MANWYGACRSNYFRVKDPVAFLDWAEKCGLKAWKNQDDDKLWAISTSDMDDSGGWPTSRYDEDGDAVDEDISVPDELALHLQDGEVAVLMEIGHEKLRYLTGQATAVNAKGERVDISIGDIYDLAKQKLGAEPTRAEY